jgi:hypothetical protein
MSIIVNTQRRIWVNAMWDVRRSAGCTVLYQSRDARRGASHKARRATYGREGKTISPLEGTSSWMRRGLRDASGSRFPSIGVAFRRIGDKGSKGESIVRRCPPTFHSWVPSSHHGSWERRFESRQRLRKIGSCSSLNSQKEQIPT